MKEMIGVIGISINIGYTGEKNARKIKFDISEWMDMWPGTTPNMMVRREGDAEEKPVETEIEGKNIIWTIRKYDTQKAGCGKMWIVFTDEAGDQVGITPETCVGVTAGPTMINGETPKELLPDWMIQVLDATETAEEAIAASATAAAAEKTATAAAQTASDDARAARAAADLAAAAVSHLEGIVLDASGAVISLDDASGMPLAGMQIYGRTTQASVPTPSAPVPLVTAAADTGKVDFRISGKNLIDISALTASRSVLSISGNEVNIKTRETGTKAYAGADSPSMMFIPGVKYTMSATVTAINSGVVRIGVRRSSDAYFVPNTSIMFNTTGSRSITFTVSEPVRAYVSMLITWADEIDGDATFSDVQLEISDAATPYAEYRDGGNVTVSTPGGLPGIPVTSGGNYTDADGQHWVCDEIDFVRGVHVQRVGQLTADGTTNKMTSALKSASGLWRVYRRLADADMSSNAMRGALLCTHYKGELSANKDNVCYVSSDGYMMLHADNNISENMIPEDEDKPTIVSNYNAWLTANPVTVLYPLAVPVETALDADTLAAYAALRTNKLDTTITSTEDIRMHVQYGADIKTYIDRKFDALASAVIGG